MESIESLLLQPGLLYFTLIAAAWIGMLMLLIPGTGIIEIVAAIGLLYAVFGLLHVGASLAGLLLIIAAFIFYAVAVLRSYWYASEKVKSGLSEPPPLLGAVVGTVVQTIGGLLMAASLPGLEWWLVIALALGSLAIYRWMLIPTVNALRPPPQTGMEALIGAQARVRKPPRGPDKPGTVFISGELWAASSEDTLQEGDLVDVVARDGMSLVVQKAVMARPPSSEDSDDAEAL